MTEIPKWHLHRDYHEVEKNTSLGRLTGTGTLKAPIELQTVENFKRRIPAGHTYRCRRDYWYNGSRVTFEIIWPWDEDGDGDPDRDRILFHPANAVRSASG